MATNQYGGGYDIPNDFSDDENTPLTPDDVEEQRSSVRLWDAFKNFRPENDSTADKSSFELISLKISKLILYLLIFIAVLGGGVVAKGTILFMTSQLNGERVIVYCNNQLDLDRQFVVTLPEEERIAWIWCIIFAFIVPDIFTVISSLRNCIFKRWEMPPVTSFLLVSLIETFHVVGSAIMFLAVLPDLDVVKGAMLTNCVCFVPGLLGLLSRFKDKNDANRGVLMLIDVAAFLAQATGFLVWPLLYPGKPSLWLLPPALILISCRWWENYVSAQSSIGIIKLFGRLKDEIRSTRYFVTVFISAWRSVAFLISAMVILHFKGMDVADLFSSFGDAFGDHNVTLIEINSTIANGTIPGLSEVLPNATTESIAADVYTPLYVLLIQTVCAFFVYEFGKFACKISHQGFIYGFPLNITVPVSISLLIAACGLRNADPCAFSTAIPNYLFFESPPSYTLNEIIANEHAWIWLLWLFSQIWITLHIWSPKCERLASTKKLFVIPMYDAFLVDQSMGLNRRIDDQPEYETIEGNRQLVARIFACATMWHEEESEMIQFFKSILRLDADQCARRVAQKYFKIVDPDYYELETHIFFDDAFCCMHENCNSSPCLHNNDESQVNKYVKGLVKTIHEYADKKKLLLRGPKKYPTPYGGRLVWTLPGNTKMIAHLKDTNKIRKKKRWSQVMYMYYLLGHRLMQLPIDPDRKTVMAMNTYLLTLDGDIDFQPSAVRLLVDLMKKNDDLGAACGRIHPIGSGPMVWFQMFEYAIGHWLQKATEHTLGCVLCSPGCFSLFRATALMDNNVMRKYTTKSTEAKHFVQYDQGEDRWLCTLLLQRGYGVEYCAASDAYTHAPESFNDFYTQRRRWIPSTMANIFDLLMDARHTIQENNNISMPYIIYQTLLMGSTILGPGTIFLMLVGAFVVAFNLDNWTSFYYNLIPVSIFMIVCATCKSKTQLFVAAVISTIYGMVMIAVLVGIMIQIAEDGWVAPSSLLFFMVAGQLVIAGLFHPQELLCLPCGLIYYVTVPSMYMLLIIYSMFNLNDVSWGTREVKAEKPTQEVQQEQVDAKKSKHKGKQKLLRSLQAGGNDDDDKGSIEFSLAGLFKCMLCTHGKPSDEKQQLTIIADSLNQLGKRLESIERAVDQGHSPGRRLTSSTGSRTVDPLFPIGEDVPEEDESTTSQESETNHERNFLVSPYWLEDEGLRKGEVDFLSTHEEQFWKDLLDKYLLPLDFNEADKKENEQNLRTLRDQSVFKFFMLNALFVLIIFLMQLNKDLLYINWPLGIKYNVTYDETALEIHITKEYLQLEPIGVVFILSFALILFVQFVAMLFHRFSTFAHILANTPLDWYCFKRAKELTEDEILTLHGVELVKELQSINELEQDFDPNNEKTPGRRRTIVHLENNIQKTHMNDTLENLPRRKSVRKSKALKVFEERRTSIMIERRRSQMKDLGGGNIYGAAGDDFNPSRRPEDSLGEINRGFQADDEIRIQPRFSQVKWRDNTSEL